MDRGSGDPFGSGVLSAGDVVERSRDGLACCVDSVALQRGVSDGSAGNPDCSCVFREAGLGVKMTGTVAAVPQTCFSNSPDLENVADGKIHLAYDCSKKHQNLFFQTVNHAKVIWDPTVKSRGIFGGHLNIRSLTLKCDEIRI